MSKGRPVNFTTLRREECKTFGEKLAFGRAKLRISQGELARRVGCTREYICMIESNVSKKTPNWRLARKMAEVIGESFEWLTETEDQAGG